MTQAPAAVQKSGLALAVVLLALASGAATAAFGLSIHALPDFFVFWTAARHATDPLLYDSNYLSALQTWFPGPMPRPFVYPPTFLLIAYPFGFLPAVTSYLVWSALSCAAFVLAAQRIVRPAWASALLPLCLPVLMALGYGQSVLFAGAALIAGVAELDRRPRLAGVLIALAACIKPQLMLLSPVLLVGRWQALGAAVVAGAALVLASLAFGPGHWLEWLGALPRFRVVVHQMPLHFINLLDPALGLPAQAIVIAGGVGFALWCARRSPAERIVGVVAGSLCCIPYAVRPDMALFAPSALVWLIGGRSAADWIRRLAGLAMMVGLLGTSVGVAALMVSTVVAGLWPSAARADPPLAEAAA
jgi:hypothetical protein